MVHAASPVRLNLGPQEGTSRRRVSGAKVLRDNPTPRYIDANALCVYGLSRISTRVNARLLLPAAVPIRIHVRAIYTYTIMYAHTYVHT